MPNTPIITAPPAPMAAQASRAVSALAAALLGLLFLWGVGFSPVAAFHNAAHDTRHSNGFPCH